MPRPPRWEGEIPLLLPLPRRWETSSVSATPADLADPCAGVGIGKTALLEVAALARTGGGTPFRAGLVLPSRPSSGASSEVVTAAAVLYGCAGR